VARSGGTVSMPTFNSASGSRPTHYWGSARRVVPPRRGWLVEASATRPMRSNSCRLNGGLLLILAMRLEMISTSMPHTARRHPHPQVGNSL
jgi:hypothetical protein